MKEYPLYPARHYESFQEFVKNIGSEFGHLPAITEYSPKGEKISHTYSDLAKDVWRVADEMDARGWRGIHMAIVGENSYDWVALFLAAVCRDNTVIPIDIEQPTELIGHYITHADTEMVFVSKSMRGVLKQLPEIASLPTVSLDIRELSNLEREEEELRTEKGNEKGRVLMYTSGTTDAPKAVELSLEGILENAAESIAMVKTTKKVYTCLPLYHAYGLTCGVLANLMFGAEIGLNGNLKTMVRDFSLFNPGTVMAVPLIAELLYKMLFRGTEQDLIEQIEKAGSKRKVFRRRGQNKTVAFAKKMKEEILGDVSLMICGGAYLSVEMIERLQMFGIQVLQGYGITECSPLVCVNRNCAARADSVGRFLPGFRGKISSEGELLVAGSGVMRGYYKEEALTKEAFSGEWFKTGDLARMDKQGYVYLSGRMKNLIVLKNGKKIVPEEMEGYVKRIALVKDAIVYGAASGLAEDDCKVAVTIYPDPEKAGNMASYEILAAVQKEIDKINKHLPMYQQIQLVNISEQEPARTALSKIRRPEQPRSRVDGE